MTFKIGFHVSISGGIPNSVSNALELGCTAFQIFTRNPRGWLERALVESEVESFKSAIDKSGIEKDCVAVYMPYMLNLSAPDGETYEKSIQSLTNELIRCSRLGIEYLITRLGNHFGKGKDNGIKQLVKSCESAIDNYKSRYDKKLDVTILLENGWGSNNAVGCTLEELREILDKLPSQCYGICLDTCHAFVSGYDLRTADACVKFFEKFDKIIGLDTLKLIHLNDSKGDINSRIDRHEHIGLGKIGTEGLASIINEKSVRNLPFIMEAPIDSVRDQSKELEVVLKLRT